MQESLQKLDSVGVTSPTLQYEQRVAQIVYCLPTVWPANEDYILALNEVEPFYGGEVSKFALLSSFLIPVQVPKGDHADLTHLIREGNNDLMLIFQSDLDRFYFCLFEKQSSDTD